MLCRIVWANLAINEHHDSLDKAIAELRRLYPDCDIRDTSFGCWNGSVVYADQHPESAQVALLVYKED